MKFFVTSDIHGSKALIQLILEVIKQEHIDALVIAGNIAPKGLYQFFKVGSQCNIHTDSHLKNRKNILAGEEHQVKSSLDLLGFMEVFKRDHHLSSTKTRQRNKLREICCLLQTANIPVYMLSGNDDYIMDNTWHEILSEYGIHNLNLRTYNMNKFKLTGFQYILPSLRRTHNELPECDLGRQLKNIEDHVDNNSILVTHCPPMGILDRRTNGSTEGSASIFNLIKAKQPAFHVFGHVHESFGNVKVDNTICCNVSSLWSDWLLRGYIIDTDSNMSIKKIEKEIAFNESTT
jgi:Icc-related predicted phosphoesterase